MMINEIIKQFRDYTTHLESIKSIEEEGWTWKEKEIETWFLNVLRELSYKVGSFFENRKPMKESHKQLRKELEAKAINIVNTLSLNEYLVGVSVSFVGPLPVDRCGFDWEFDGITKVLEIRIAMECGIDIGELQQFKNAFKVDDNEICVAGHKYGKMSETTFNNDWIEDVRIIIDRDSFETLGRAAAN